MWGPRWIDDADRSSRETKIITVDLPEQKVFEHESERGKDARAGLLAVQREVLVHFMAVESNRCCRARWNERMAEIWDRQSGLGEGIFKKCQKQW